MKSLPTSWLFLIIASLSLASQLLLWHNNKLIDLDSWLTEVQYFKNHDVTQLAARPFYGYPATSLMLLTIMLSTFGLSLKTSFIWTIALCVSLTTGALIVWCRRLSPNTLWWLAAAGLLMFNAHFHAATPPSAVIFPLLAFITLLFLECYQQKEYPPELVVLIGISAGFAFATRLDISLAVFGWWWLTIGWSLRRFSGGLLLVAGLTFFLLDPYLWFMPVQHLVDIVTKIFGHYAFKERGVTYQEIIEQASLAIASFVLVSGAYVAKFDVLPRRFIQLLMGLTLILTTILLSSHYHPIWYFLPLIFLWELLLPLYVLVGIKGYTPPRILAQSLSLILVILFIAYQIITTVHIYLLPDEVYLVY